MPRSRRGTPNSPEYSSLHEPAPPTYFSVFSLCRRCKSTYPGRGRQEPAAGPDVRTSCAYLSMDLLPFSTHPLDSARPTETVVAARLELLGPSTRESIFSPSCETSALAILICSWVHE